MKSTSASLMIELNVECPNCERYFNILDEECNDCDDLYHEVLSDEAMRNDHKDFDFDFDCPFCQKEFNINEIDW